MATITSLTQEGAFQADLRNAINTNFTNINTDLVALGAGVVAGSAAYTAADTGTKTLAAASTVDRTVTITLTCTTVFANGDGAQPTVSLGQTSATTKFAATTAFTNMAAATSKTFSGTLSANTALLATQVAGTGTTETGAYTLGWTIIR